MIDAEGLPPSHWPCRLPECMHTLCCAYRHIKKACARCRRTFVVLRGGGALRRTSVRLSCRHSNKLLLFLQLCFFASATHLVPAGRRRRPKESSLQRHLVPGSRCCRGTSFQRGLFPRVVVPGSHRCRGTSLQRGLFPGVVVPGSRPVYHPH
jgi:hypothetical protein